MSVDPSAISSSSIECGACKTTNDSSARFCCGCGHALYDKCAQCDKPVLLTQAFCGKCGTDLTKAIESQRSHYEKIVQQAVGAAKQDEFEESLALLARVAAIEDFRFKELATNAGLAKEKVRQIADQRWAMAEEATKRAQPAIENDRHYEVIEILKNAPSKLISDKARDALRRAEAYVASEGALSNEIKKAFDQKNWLDAGPLLTQFHELEPGNQECLSLSRKVAAKLVGSAQAAKESLKYKLAIKYLDAVPMVAHDAVYNELRSKIEDIIWLKAQFKQEPFDTPTLGRLAVRLEKEDPRDPRHKKRIAAIAENLKQSERPDRSQYPYRLPNAPSKFGGTIGYLSSLTCVQRADLPAMRPHWGKMNVAIGLGLQGLGLGRVQSQLIQQKGLFKLMRNRKSESVWGLDIGTHSVKGVLMKKSESGVEIVDGFLHEFEHPLCRPGYDENPLEKAADELDALVEQRDFGDTPIWINMPSTGLISRFTLLPPVNDKIANNLIRQECEKRIPLELDTLCVESWIAPYNPDSVTGRPVVVTAVKKSAIEERLDALKLEGGLNIVGMQADPVALVNLISVEFADVLEAEVEDEEKIPTIALIHSGAETTVAILVSKNAHWVWSVEFGGEDLTGQLARALKTNRSESEPLKCNPHQLESLASDYAPVEDRLELWSARVSQLIDDAKGHNPAFQITATFGSGGASLTHQWFRRVLLRQ